MKLTRVGLAKFNRLAADLYAKSEPQNEVAIVVNGQVYSSPAFQSDSFAGPIQVSGSFSSAEPPRRQGTQPSDPHSLVLAARVPPHGERRPSSFIELAGRCGFVGR